MDILGSTVALLIAFLFFVAAILHLLHPTALRAAYREAGYSKSFEHVVAIIAAVVAALLVTPQLRVWGCILAAIVLFVLCAKLLFRERYLYAVPAIIVLFALGPAMA